MKEACDTVVAQVEERFCKSDHLIAAQLVDCTLFRKSFPSAELEYATNIWPIGNKVELKAEMKSLYTQICLYTQSLLQWVYDNSLQDDLSETVTADTNNTNMHC